jgi:esterase/lipase
MNKEDIILNELRDFRKEYREDKNKQEIKNEQITINKTDIKNMKRLPLLISSLSALLACVSILIVIITGG